MVHDPGEVESPPVINFAKLTVDIEAMEDFIRLMQSEIDQNLEPYSNEIINDHYSGGAIASYSASVPLSAFRQSYYSAVNSSVQGLRSYLESTKVLLRALQLLAHRYRGSNVMAAAQMNDVLGAMSLAQQQITAEAQAYPNTPV